MKHFLGEDKTRSQPSLHSPSPDHQEANLVSSEREIMGNAPSESKDEETTLLSDASLPLDNSFASSISQNTSVASARHMIQELAFGLEEDPNEEARLWFSIIDGSSSSSDEDDDPSSLYGTTAADSFLVGSFAGSAIPDLDSDDDLDANNMSWDSLATDKNKKSVSIDSIPTRRLAQHHLYLTGLCLASIRRQDENGGPRRDILSSDFEKVVDESLGAQDGRPYPADIWQTWSSWKAENQTDSPLLSDVLIRSIPPLAVNDIVYSICIAPQLDMATIVISTTSEHKTGKAWKEYLCEGMTVGMDSCWGDIVCADPFLIKDIMAKLPQKFSNVSFVGVGGGAAVSTLCGLCAPQHTNASISVYSFGAPRLGGGRMVQLYRRLENEGRLRILSVVNVCDAVSRHPKGWWNLRSGFRTVGRSVYFSSKVKGMHGYWQHLQNWDAQVPFEEWFKLEEPRHRWSKKWIVVLFIIAIYAPIILLTLVSPGLQTFRAMVTRESPSMISSAPTRVNKLAWLGMPKVSEIACEEGAKNVSHQPVAKAQAESREDVEKDSEQTKEADKEDAAVTETGVNLGILHVELGKAVNFDIVADLVDHGIKTPLSSPNSTDKTVLSDVPIVHTNVSHVDEVLEFSSGMVSTVNIELLMVDEVAQSDANKVDAAVLASIKSPQGLTIPMEGKPERNVVMEEVVLGGEIVPRMLYDANRPESNEVDEIIETDGQDSSLGFPSEDDYIHVPQVTAFDDDLSTDVNYGVNDGEQRHGVAIDEDVAEDADSSFVVSVEQSEPGQVDEENPAVSTFSDGKSEESKAATVFSADLDLGDVIDEKESTTDLLACYEDLGIPRAMGIVTNPKAPAKSLQDVFEIVVEEIVASDSTGTESLAYVAETSDCTETDEAQLREVSVELIAPEDEVLKVHHRQHDLDVLREEESAVAAAHPLVETSQELTGKIADSIHLGDAIVKRGVVATEECDNCCLGLADPLCLPMRDSACHFEVVPLTFAGMEHEALAEPNTAVDEDSSREHRGALHQDVELDALAMPQNVVDDECSKEHRDAVDQDASYREDVLEQQSRQDAHDFQNKNITTMDPVKVDDIAAAKSILLADGVQTYGKADMGVCDPAKDASLIGADPDGQFSGHDPGQSQSEPESDLALEIGSNSQAVRRSQPQELSIAIQVSDRPWGSSVDKSFLARSNRLKLPPPLLLELDMSVMESRLQRQAVNRVFDRWGTMNWWKNQAANRLDAEAAASAIVREAFLRSGIELDG